MTWENDIDVDLYMEIMAFKKSDGSICYTNCSELGLELDYDYGIYGDEPTSSLQYNGITEDYVYVIGVVDYDFKNNGQSFLNAGVSVTVTNGVKTEVSRMVAVADTISRDTK